MNMGASEYAMESEQRNGAGRSMAASQMNQIKEVAFPAEQQAMAPEAATRILLLFLPRNRRCITIFL
jgi:hypothetical protein